VNYLSQPKGDVKFSKPAASETRAPAPDVVTTFAPGMLITGNVLCTGAVHIYGRVIGEIRASHLIVSEGASIEGKVTVQEAIIQGTFKGILHGSSVKLQGTAVVEGEIHNKALTIEQNALFEGVSRRLERPVEAPTMDDINAAIPKRPSAYGAEPLELTAADAAPAIADAPATDIDFEILR
jgi:cytoskeletal protein CcmA (bactofilin family)